MDCNRDNCAFTVLHKSQRVDDVVPSVMFFPGVAKHFPVVVQILIDFENCYLYILFGWLAMQKMICGFVR